MKPFSIKFRIFSSFFMIILTLGVSTFFLGYYVVQNDVLGRALNQVEQDLDSARSVFTAELKTIGKYFDIADFTRDPEKLRKAFSLDYFRFIDVEGAKNHKSKIINKAVKEGECGGTRIISSEELKNIDEELASNAKVEVVPTPKARPASIKTLEDAMAIEYAKLLRDENGQPTGIIYGGRVINGHYELTDKISSFVYEDRVYDSKPVGTVTIFQDDIRVSTNVLGPNGHRAVGTRVSKEVYDKVVGEGEKWIDSAFVVTNRYITAYEPIRDVAGNIIGMLYVGTLEKPFRDMILNLVLVFLFIGFAAITFGGWLSYILAEAISRPVQNLLHATHKISGGKLGTFSANDTSIAEFNELAESFNQMSTSLAERDRNLKIINEKLEESNKNYVDLIGFVAHELKGLLASAIMNAYSLRDGYLGMINFKQQRAIDSITRNLDYLAATVKKFLNLGRIQKGEMELNRREVNLAVDIYDVSIETFSNQFKAKNVTVENNIDRDLVVSADAELMLIVANNLISNAAKYSTGGGQVEVKSSTEDNKVVIEVYNDSRPISEDAKSKLFKKFSRLDVPERKTVKGTGLGLYISKEIVEAHGGKIYVVPRDKGNSFIFHIERGM